MQKTRKFMREEGRKERKKVGKRTEKIKQRGVKIRNMKSKLNIKRECRKRKTKSSKLVCDV